MPTPEQIHADITSGRAGPIRSLGQDLLDESRRLDDACNEVLDGLGVTDWDSNAQLHFTLRGQRLYVSVSLAAWRLFRCGDLLTNVADQYELTVEEADAQLRAWQALTPEQRAEPSTRASWVTALAQIKEGWSDQLARAALDLTDDERDAENGNQSDRDWAAEGAGMDFLHHLANGTRRGPRIPNSYLNTGEDWVQQGLAFDRRNNQYLMTSWGLDGERSASDEKYLSDNPKTSSLTLIDRESGAETRSVELTGPPHQPGTQPQHSGGVTVVGDDVYVVSTEYEGDEKEAGGSSPHVYRYSLRDIERTPPGQPVQAQARFDVPASSYISHDGGSFYLGEYSENGPGALTQLSPGQMAKLEARRPGDPMPEFPATRTPPGVNGAVVLPDRIVYSQNNTRDDPSRLITGPLSGSTDEDGTEAPNLIEETTRNGRDLTSLNEAGAGAYSPQDADSGDGLWAQTHMTVAPGAAGPGGDVEVEPQTLRSASRIFAGVSDDVSGVRNRTSGTSLPADTMGDVIGAVLMSNATGTQSDKIAEDLQSGSDGAETVFEGLRWCADGYEITDHASYSAIDLLTGGLIG